VTPKIKERMSQLGRERSQIQVFPHSLPIQGMSPKKCKQGRGRALVWRAQTAGGPGLTFRMIFRP
jgi:hypothetical protein